MATNLGSDRYSGHVHSNDLRRFPGVRIRPGWECVWADGSQPINNVTTCVTITVQGGVTAADYDDQTIGGTTRFYRAPASDTMGCEPSDFIIEVAQGQLVDWTSSGPAAFRVQWSSSS